MHWSSGGEWTRIPADAGEHWSAPAPWGWAPLEAALTERGAAEGAGLQAAPEQRPWPGSGYLAPPTHPCMPRGSRKGGPGGGVSGLDVEVPLGPGNMDLRPLSALSEHKSWPPTSPHSTPYPPPLSGCRAHRSRTGCPHPGSPATVAQQPRCPRRPPRAARRCSGHFSVPSEHSLSHKSPRPLLRLWV